MYIPLETTHVIETTETATVINTIITLAVPIAIAIAIGTGNMRVIETAIEIIIDPVTRKENDRTTTTTQSDIMKDAKATRSKSDT